MGKSIHPVTLATASEPLAKMAAGGNDCATRNSPYPSGYDVAPTIRHAETATSVFQIVPALPYANQHESK
jgi:hypothetical protein